MKATLTRGNSITEANDLLFDIIETEIKQQLWDAYLEELVKRVKEEMEKPVGIMRWCPVELDVVEELRIGEHSIPVRIDNTLPDNVIRVVPSVDIDSIHKHPYMHWNLLK